MITSELISFCDAAMGNNLRNFYPGSTKKKNYLLQVGIVKKALFLIFSSVETTVLADRHVR